jgi:hypothetical protein
VSESLSTKRYWQHRVKQLERALKTESEQKSPSPIAVGALLDKLFCARAAVDDPSVRPIFARNTKLTRRAT